MNIFKHLFSRSHRCDDRISAVADALKAKREELKNNGLPPLFTLEDDRKIERGVTFTYYISGGYGECHRN